MTAVEKWVNGYKLTYFPWIDGKRIYLNIQYYKPGSAVSRPAAFEKTVFLADNSELRDLLQNHNEALVEYIVQEVLCDKSKEREGKQ